MLNNIKTKPSYSRLTTHWKWSINKLWDFENLSRYFLTTEKLNKFVLLFPKQNVFLHTSYNKTSLKIYFHLYAKF